MTNTFVKQEKSIQLTARDLGIFDSIEKEGAKTASEISMYFWPDKSKESNAAFQRIRRLTEAGYLKHGNPKLLYLTDQGKEVLVAKKQTQSVEEAKPNA